jgi:hypothetical protein
MRKMIVSAAIVVLLALSARPFLPFATLARTALDSGRPSLAFTLLKAGAAIGDPLARNDLGVLYFRGEGVDEDPAEAARMITAASEAGLPRARLNLALAKGDHCRIEKDGSPFFDTAEAMALAGDVIGASFAVECFTKKNSSNSQHEVFATLTERLARIAAVAATGDGEEKVKMAWALIEASGDRWNADGAARSRLLDIAARALLEARADKPSAFFGLATLRGEAGYLDRLKGAPSFDEVMRFTTEEWLQQGVTAGHQVSSCTLASRYMDDFFKTFDLSRREELQSIPQIILPCLSQKDQRDFIRIQQPGRSMPRIVGQDRLLDRWRGEGPLLIKAPYYEDYDFSRRAQDQALARIEKLEKMFGS